MIKNEHPILFSTPMVKAILEGRKTQTRRTVKPQPDDSGLWNHSEFPMSIDSNLEGWHGTVDETGENKRFKCKYGKPGSILWTRETFTRDENGHIGYKASPETWRTKENGFNDGTNWINWQWTPSIFMPRSASRIDLLVKDIRIERLQDITEEDAIKEGTPIPVSEENNVLMPLNGKYFPTDYFKPVDKTNYNRAFYGVLWDEINGKTYPWNSNPWVWVIEFEKIKNE
jgi:hypothetical protein